MRIFLTLAAFLSGVLSLAAAATPTSTPTNHYNILPLPPKVFTAKPISYPSRYPTTTPSVKPTAVPTAIPTTIPTEVPTFGPTSEPTAAVRILSLSGTSGRVHGPTGSEEVTAGIICLAVLLGIAAYIVYLHRMLSKEKTSAAAPYNPLKARGHSQISDASDNDLDSIKVNFPIGCTHTDTV